MLAVLVLLCAMVCAVFVVLAVFGSGIAAAGLYGGDRVGRAVRAAVHAYDREIHGG